MMDLSWKGGSEAEVGDGRITTRPPKSLFSIRDLVESEKETNQGILNTLLSLSSFCF